MQCRTIAAELSHRPRQRLRFRTPNEAYHRLPLLLGPWVAAYGKPFASCPRPRPKAYRSEFRAYFQRRDRFTFVALQT